MWYISKPHPSLPAVVFTATVPPPSLVKPVKSQELKSNEYPDVQFWVQTVELLTPVLEIISILPKIEVEAVPELAFIS